MSLSFQMRLAHMLSRVIITLRPYYHALKNKIYSSTKLTHMSNGTPSYEIKYTIEGMIYKMEVLKKKGPFRVMRVTNMEEEDLTSYLLEYLGPNEDFHGKTTMPKDFGMSLLKFDFFNGSSKTFSRNEEIKF